MIIVRLWGGLGNQMFQYAAARRLALLNEDLLKLDTGWFAAPASGGAERVYELGVFALKAPFASPSEVRSLRGADMRRLPGWLKRALRGCGYQGARSCITEKHFHFDPGILALKGDVYLDGYWQSEKYFSDVADLLRDDFHIVPEPDSRNRDMLEQIRSSGAVSLHVRRGDYVSSKKTGDFHGVIPINHYSAAVERIAGMVPDPHFFIFSDDPAWARENIHPDFPSTFVDHNGPARAYEDLRLLANCKHHIIANSSFSWWGAWLCPYPDKVVIAPAKWFNRTDLDTSDLIPETWLKL